MSKRLIIIGAGGHGKVVCDIARLCGYDDIAFLDDRDNGGFCLGYPVIGKVSDADKYPEAEFFVAIGNAKIRENILNQLEKNGLGAATLIHPNAIVASGVKIGSGTAVMAGAVINPETAVGRGCIINTGATVDHDNKLEDFVHVSVGSHLAGEVSVGKYTWIGAGATVSNGITVCGGCMIGAGAVVVKNIDKAGTYMGVPARRKCGSGDE